MERELEADRVHDAAKQAAYPERLMRTLARATSREFNMTLKVVDNHNVVDMQFQLTDNDDTAWFLNSTWSGSTWNTDIALDDLEFDMDRKALQQAETTRKYNLRVAALAKLTAEEKELLNLA